MTFHHEGHTVHASASLDEHGHLAEMFLSSGKTGTLIDTVARELTAVVSIALQSNVPTEIIEDALPKLDNGDPAGPLGCALQHMRALSQAPRQSRTISPTDQVQPKSEGEP